MPSTKVSSFKLNGLAKRAALAGLVSMVLVSGAFHDSFVAHAKAAALDARPAAAATADAKHAKTSAEPAHDRTIRSLDDAVDKRLLDNKAAKALKAGKSVDLLVSFAFKTVNRDAQIDAPKGKGHNKAAVATMRKGFGAMKDRTLHGQGVKVLKGYPNLPTAFVRFHSAAALLRVLRDPDVLGASTPMRYEPNATSVQPNITQIRQPEVASAGNTGANTYVAVLDSGVDYTRAAFGSCVAPGAGCKVSELIKQPGDNNLLDDSSVKHGTNVAGIVLDVAPSTRIIGYDVFKDSGYGWGAADPDMTAALNDVITKAATRTIASVNLSIGWSGRYENSSCTTTPNGGLNPFTGVLSSLRALRIAPVFSTGNDAADGASFHEGVTYPGCTAGAIRVGAVYNGSYPRQEWEFTTVHGCYDSAPSIDLVTCFSQSSRTMLSVLAPGANITAAGQTLRGTSQAAPHVAGAFAVLKGVRPYAAVDYLAKAVTTTGPNVTDNRFAAGPITAHRLDLAAALAAVKLDATAPALTAPRVNFTPGATLGTDAAMSVDTTWSATDANGIGSYVIQIGVNGVFTDKTSALSPATSTALTFTGMKPGTTYEVRVAAGDRAGNWTGWVSTGPFKVYALDQTNTTITRSTGWSTAAYAPGYGGSISVTSTNGAWTRYSVPARSIAWVGTSATNRGKATVTVGTTATTVDASAASTLNRRVEFVAKNLDVTKSTTVTIANQATSGRPSIDVDAILVIQ